MKGKKKGPRKGFGKEKARCEDGMGMLGCWMRGEVVSIAEEHVVTDCSNGSHMKVSSGKKC